MKKIFRQIHLWLSVPFGLIVTLICLSGAILLFEKDFGQSGQANVECNGRTPLPMDSIIRTAQATLSDSITVVGVTTYPDPDKAYKVMLSKPAMAALWVNQYTGEVIGKYKRPAIFKWASSAHRRLFGKSKAEGAHGANTGKLIIGISTIAMLLIIISGLIVWWPAKGHVKSKFRIATKQGCYRFWFDFHSVGGVVSTLVIVICILTGLNWSFGWYRKAFYHTFGTEAAKPASHVTPAENLTAWTSAYQQLRTAHPDKEIRMYQEEADVVMGGNGNQQATDTYGINPDNGAITSTTLYKDKKESNHIKGWIYSLHAGAWLGWFTRIIYLICVIIGAILPISGYYLWIKRLMLKKRHSA